MLTKRICCNYLTNSKIIMPLIKSLDDELIRIYDLKD